MKKTFKRAGVAVLSMAMLLSMGAVGLTANAARSTTVTIPSDKVTGSATGLPATQTVTWYKVAVSGDSGWEWCDSFTFTSAQLTELQGLIPTGCATTTLADSNDVFSVLGDSTVGADSAFVKRVATILDDKTNWTKTGTGTTSTSDSTANSFTISDSDDHSGYYLAKVTSNDASYIVQPILFELDSSTSTYTTGTLKATKVTLDKIITNVTNASTGESTNASGKPGAVKADGKAADAAAGDTVSYQITTNFPTYSDKLTSLPSGKNFTISDTMTSTLTLDGTSVVVTNTTDNVVLSAKDSSTHSTAGTNPANSYQYELTPDASGHSFTISFADVYELANKSESIKVTFNATLSATPNYGTTSNDNTADATFGNDFETGGGNGDVPDSTVKVYCAKLLVTKKDQSSVALNGAGFTLYVKDKDNNWDAVGSEIVNTTGNTFAFNALTVGDYKLVETTTPPNYTKSADILFTVSDNNFDGNFTTNNASVTPDGTVSGQLDTTVTNTHNGSLPGTGGMGTVLFTVGGAAIVLLAGALFVVYMRKRKVEE